MTEHEFPAWRSHGFSGAMEYPSEESWYVVRIRSKAERLVQVGLHRKHFEVLHPTYQVLSERKDRRKLLTKPIFVGYMFVHVQLSPERHLEILKTQGVIEMLKNSQGPIPVPDEQIKNVKLLEHHVGQCFHSPDFAVGDAVFVREGPLTGLRGVVDRVNRRQLRIHVDAMPGSIVIEIDPRQVQLERETLYTVVAGR